MSLTQREIELATMPIPKLFLKFSIPAITGMLVQALYNIVDRIFIGHMSENSGLALSGIGITMPVIFIMMGFSMLFGIGAAANISIKLGEQRKDTAQQIFMHALLMLAINGILMFAILQLFMDPLLRLFAATPLNMPFAKDYLRIISIGYLWNTFAFGFSHMIRAEGMPKVAMIGMFIGAISNTILDPIFIFYLDMGVKGAAIATIIAQALSMAWSLNYYFSKGSMMKIRLSGFTFDAQLLKLIVAIGVSPFFIQIAGSVVGALMNNQLRIYGGELAQSAYIAFSTIAQLFFMPIFGMNQGMQPIIGYNYGARNYDRVRQTVKVALAYASLVCTLGWALIQLMPSTLVTIVTKEPQVVALSVSGLRIYESLMFLVGIQVISSNFFHSIGKAGISFILSLSRQFFLLVPLVLFLPRYFGLQGIWMATPISDSLATLITVIFLVLEFKKMKRLELN